MSLRRFSMLAAALVLTACNGKLPAQPGDPARPNGTASTRPRPSAQATEPLGMKPPTALSLLKAPPGAAAKLTGVVSIDAHYAVKAAGATLIGADGASLIGADGASLIGPDGATLVGMDGASLIGMDGASVYVGAGLIGADGGSLIGPDGASLVAAGAGNLIGKRKLALMQAATQAKFNLGTILRAAAMEIQVRSMIDGKPLQLGTDEAGQPVFSVYTNAKGEYQVYLPGTISGKNVVVSAAVPASQDSRLFYDAMFDKGQGAAAVGEDTALASAFLRQAFVSRLERLFIQKQNDSPVVSADSLLPPGSGGVADAALARLRAAADKAEVAIMTPSDRRARAAATGDALLSYVDLQAQTQGDRPSLEVMAEELARFRERATAKMLADPRYFETQPFLIRANRRLVEEDKDKPVAQKRPLYAIEKPSDVADFVLQDILMSPVRERTTNEFPQVLDAVGYLPAERDAAIKTLGGIMDGLLLAAGTVVIANPSIDDGKGGQIFALDAAVAAMEATP